jgi:hypothetical protein
MDFDSYLLQLSVVQREYLLGLLDGLTLPSDEECDNFIWEVIDFD